MTLCAVTWCACLAVGDSEHCAVHAKSPNLRPGELPPKDPAADPDCKTCGGDGDCPGCGGVGEQECDMGHMHDCPECDGDGYCPDCGV